MVTLTTAKANYYEFAGLSTDTKPSGIDAAPNGSKFYEIDTQKTLYFNGDTGDWFDHDTKYPTKLEVYSNKYKVTYSDSTTKTSGVVVTLSGNKAYYVENAMKVSCDAIVVAVTITGDTETAVYDEQEHTASGYTASADKSTIYDVSTDIEYLGVGTPTAKRTEVGKTMMGLDKSDFKNLNNQYIVNFTVTDGYVEITAPEEQNEPAAE